MLSKVLSCQRAPENMYAKGSQTIVNFRGALKRGFLAKKGGGPKRLRTPMTSCNGEHPALL